MIRLVIMTENEKPESFTKELGREIAGEARSVVRSVAVGSLMTGTVGAFAGLYSFGLIGLALGAALGAIAGGVILFAAYLES